MPAIDSYGPVDCAVCITTNSIESFDIDCQRAHRWTAPALFHARGRVDSEPCYPVGMDDVRGLVGYLRGERGWTYAALADRLGVHWQTVRNWHLGAHPPANPGPVLAMLRQLQTARVPKRHRAKPKA